MIEGYEQWRDDSLCEAWERGRVAGVVKAWAHTAKCEAKGKVEGLASALLLVLEVRGFTLSPSEVETVRGCSDVDTLAAWLRRAVTVEKAADVFL